MKKTMLVLFLGIVCVSLAYSAGNSDYYAYSYARLSYVNGDVYIQRADDLGFEEGVVNLVLVQGDKIGTREGRAEIHFGKRNYLRINRQTQLDLIELPREGFDRIQFHLLAGDLFLRVNFLEREKDFEIHTPDASFYVLEEGLYRLSIVENLQTELRVYEGRIEAAGEEGSLVVGQDESLIAAEGFFKPDDPYYSVFDDDFAQWNYSRDEMLSQYVAKQYLPAELNEYEVELAYSGRWIYESPYGYVWVPYGVHSHWRPYHYGRWVWYPIIGWTWISHDPWGWVVHRYGRWHWRAALGWYWIPTTIWGPAWVHWHYGYNTVGWCPLSFWNRPVVIVNNIFYGQYNGSSYPAQSTALTMIHKNQLQARAISKVALAQERIGQVGRISLSARQPELRPVIDRSSASSRIASQVLAREDIRAVQKSYSSSRPSDSLSRMGSRENPRSSAGTLNRGTITRSPSQKSETENASRPDMSKRTIRSYSSSLSGASVERSERRTQDVLPGGRASSVERTMSQREGDSSRTIQRYSPSRAITAPERETSVSRRTTTPSRESTSRQTIRNSAAQNRSAVSSKTSTLSRERTSSVSSRSRATENQTIKKYASTQTRTASQRSVSRSSTSVNRISPSSRTVRSSSPTVRRSVPSSSGRSSSIRTPVRSSSPSSSSSMRSSSSSRSSSTRSRVSSSSRTTRSSSSGIRRSTSSSSGRSSSVRTPVRSSSRSSSSSMRSSSSSRSSSTRSSASSSSRSSASRVKKK